VQPEPEHQAAHDSGEVGRASLVRSPRENGAEIVGFEIERSLPLPLDGGAQALLRSVRQLEVMTSHSCSCSLEIAAFGKTLEGERPDHPQHPEPGLAQVRHAVDHALVEQRSEDVEEL
jgi:hypothetical protein